MEVDVLELSVEEPVVLMLIVVVIDDDVEIDSKPGVPWAHAAMNIVPTPR